MRRKALSDKSNYSPEFALVRRNNMLVTNRKNDAVISLYQDNQKKMVHIETLNEAAEKLLGRTKGELKGKPLMDILPLHLQEHIHSYIEFEEGGSDIAQVLSKTRKFHVVNREQVHIPVSIKVFYGVAKGSYPRFELLLRDITLFEKLELMRTQLSQERSVLKIDDQTGVLTQPSLIRETELIISFVKEYGLQAIFALFSIDRFQALHAHYGASTSLLIKELGERYQRNSRLEDMIGMVGNNTFGCILFDCHPEHAGAVLHRLKKKITSDPVAVPGEEEIIITLSGAYMVIPKDASVNRILYQCEQAIEQVNGSGGNRIIEA